MSDLLMIYRMMELPIRDLGQAWICDQLARRPTRLTQLRAWTCPHATSATAAEPRSR